MVGAAITQARRAATVDVAKGIAIIAVVFAHVALGLNSAGLLSDSFVEHSMPIYLWYMSLFFFASGLFMDRGLRRDGPGRFVRAKAVELGYPFLVWSLVFGSTQKVFSAYTNTGDLAWSTVLQGLLPWSPREHMWFLPALFIAFTVSAVCYKLGGDRWRFLLLGVSVAMLALVYVWPDEQQRLGNTFWMALGAIVAVTAVLPWLTDPRPTRRDGAVLIAAAAVFAVVLVTVIGPGRTFYDDPIAFVLAAAPGIVAVLAASKLLAAWRPTSRVLSRIGEWSLYIYLTHVPILGAVRAAMIRFLDVESGAVIAAVSVVACLGLGCLAALLAERGYLMWAFRLPPRAFAVLAGRPRAALAPASRTAL